MGSLFLFICKDVCYVRLNNHSPCSSASWLTSLITPQSRDPCGVVLLHLLHSSPPNLSRKSDLVPRKQHKEAYASLECQKTSEVMYLHLWERFNCLVSAVSLTTVQIQTCAKLCKHEKKQPWRFCPCALKPSEQMKCLTSDLTHESSILIRRTTQWLYGTHNRNKTQMKILWVWNRFVFYFGLIIVSTCQLC